jgi:hypothetical protein
MMGSTQNGSTLPSSVERHNKSKLAPHCKHVPAGRVNYSCTQLAEEWWIHAGDTSSSGVTPVQ